MSRGHAEEGSGGVQLCGEDAAPAGKQQRGLLRQFR